MLPALGYLHDRGLVYCDFKPDNVIQTEEQLKLIDMGGVRRIDGDDPIYGTVGYQAPEIADVGPSVESDLFTVARTLAVLTFEFGAIRASTSTGCPTGCRCWSTTSPTGGCCSAPPTWTRRAGSAPRGR